MSGERGSRAGKFISKRDRERGIFQFLSLKSWYKPTKSIQRERREETKIPIKRLDKNIEACLISHGIQGKVINCHEGSSVWTYELQLSAGQRIKSLMGLDAELAISLKTSSVRVIPLLNRGTVGIEIPKTKRNPVLFSDVISSVAFERKKAGRDASLSIALGKDTLGNDVIVDLATLPHLLIAGATGTGKSVCLNVILLSFLKRYSPKELGLILIDPKILEFCLYDKLPHLMHPVVIDANVAKNVLSWCVQEMEYRYSLMKDSGARNIQEYNSLNKNDILKRIVVVVDELADLVLCGEKSIVESITRLAQKARAAGIHLILATQRPSVDVVTGLIKANFPARIAFRVASSIDSRVILDSKGAEKLLGKGDALMVLPGGEGQQRVQVSYISDSEVKSICQQITASLAPQYEESLISYVETKPETITGKNGEEYGKVIEYAQGQEEISASEIQAQFSIGVAKATKYLKQLIADGIVSEELVSKGKRKVIWNN
jgi:S-DNA-T family DNA segregation ATPase FtsK/SpoIIIE